MVDITHKSNTLRIAIAQATVTVSKQATIDAIINKTVPKGDVFEMAKVAGLFGVKKTSDLIPDCHPLPIEYTNISYEIEGLNIFINIEVKTIYKTGVEVEAMHGASLVALTMYDMLKPIDKGIEIYDQVSCFTCRTRWFFAERLALCTYGFISGLCSWQDLRH